MIGEHYYGNDASYVCIALSIILIGAPRAGANSMNIHQGPFYEIKEEDAGLTIDLMMGEGNRSRHRPWELRRERRRIQLILLHERRGKGHLLSRRRSNPYQDPRQFQRGGTYVSQNSSISPFLFSISLNMRDKRAQSC